MKAKNLEIIYSNFKISYAEEEWTRKIQADNLPFFFFLSK